MNSPFANGIKLNSGTPNAPAISFIENSSSGISLLEKKTICISSYGQIVAQFGNKYLELFNGLKISRDATNNAVLTSDSKGNAVWKTNNLSGTFKWNSIYKLLDLNSDNNSVDIVFASELSVPPAIALTKESDFAIDNFDLYVKNKTKNFFTVYSNTFMSKKIVSGDVGGYASCMLCDDCIGICYYNIKSDRMEYVHSDSKYNFSSPVVIDEISVIDICDIVIVNGNPAITYITDDGTDDKWRYIRANDAVGTTWGSPVDLLSSTNDLTFRANTLFLRVIDGNPAVFLNNSVGRAQMLRATDADGTNWNNPINISNLTDHQLLEVKIVEGNPAVLAKSNVTNVLYYSRSLNSNGSSWPIGAIQLFKSGHQQLTVNNGKCCNTLSTIGGKLCIVTSEANTNDLYIVRSNDISGNTWGVYEFLTKTNTTNSFPRIFRNNCTTYMLYNNYSGDPSEKVLIEFHDKGFTKTSDFINSLIFATDHQPLHKKNDGNNIFILGSDQNISMLKFYGNDLLVNWIAMSS